MRRLDVSKDPVVMLGALGRRQGGGVDLKITETEIFIALTHEKTCWKPARTQLVCDGAMARNSARRPGQRRLRRGVESRAPGARPEIQRHYVEAGADCLITNTFGGSRLMLKRMATLSLLAINLAGARIAREAFGGREGFVLATRPARRDSRTYGDLPANERRRLTKNKPRAGRAGVDAVIIETQTARRTWRGD